MKIRVTFELDTHARKAIAHYSGEHGQLHPATYADCKRLLEGLALSDLSVIVSEYDDFQRLFAGEP